MLVKWEPTVDEESGAFQYVPLIEIEWDQTCPSDKTRTSYSPKLETVSRTLFGTPASEEALQAMFFDKLDEHQTEFREAVRATCTGQEWVQVTGSGGLGDTYNMCSQWSTIAQRAWKHLGTQLADRRRVDVMASDPDQPSGREYASIMDGSGPSAL
jgi:hypothetical protein